MYFEGSFSCFNPTYSTSPWTLTDVGSSITSAMEPTGATLSSISIYIMNPVSDTTYTHTFPFPGTCSALPAITVQLA